MYYAKRKETKTKKEERRGNIINWNEKLFSSCNELKEKKCNACVNAMYECILFEELSVTKEMKCFASKHLNFIHYIFIYEWQKSCKSC